MQFKINLVGGFNPFEHMLVKLDHFPRDRGEDKRRLKPPPTFDVALQTNYMVFMPHATCILLQIQLHHGIMLFCSSIFLKTRLPSFWHTLESWLPFSQLKGCKGLEYKSQTWNPPRNEKEELIYTNTSTIAVAQETYCIFLSISHGTNGLLDGKHASCNKTT